MVYITLMNQSNLFQIRRHSAVQTSNPGKPISYFIFSKYLYCVNFLPMPAIPGRDFVYFSPSEMVTEIDGLTEITWFRTRVCGDEIT